MSVDLPDPDGPMTAANCPRGKVTSTPRRASTAASPLPNVRFRPIARTAAPVPLGGCRRLDRRRFAHRCLLVRAPDTPNELSAGLTGPVTRVPSVSSAPVLRPLGVGEILDAALAVYRRHAFALWRIVAVVVALPAALDGALAVAERQVQRQPTVRRARWSS